MSSRSQPEKKHYGTCFRKLPNIALESMVGRPQTCVCLEDIDSMGLVLLDYVGVFV